VSGNTAALVISIISLVTSLATFTLSFYRDWRGGRRLKVTVTDEGQGAARGVVVRVENVGNTPVSVSRWGYRVIAKGRGRLRIDPPDTGPSGPVALPTTLTGGASLDPLSRDVASIEQEVSSALSGTGELRVRGFVVFDGGRRAMSPRRAAIRLPG
jgi:hypothetical protein